MTLKCRTIGSWHSELITQFKELGSIGNFSDEFFFPLSFKVKRIVLLKLSRNKETFKFSFKPEENNLKINEIETFLNDGSEIFVF